MPALNVGDTSDRDLRTGMNDSTFARARLEAMQLAEVAPGELQTTRNMIYPLQYLRALAAFSVLLGHAAFYVQESRGDGRMLDIFARGGPLGVSLFFAISGYLMAQLAEKSSGWRFLAHRLIRIYPIYWVCIALLFVVTTLFHDTIRPGLLAVMLVPGVTRAYALGVEWTLPFELTFYLIVFAVIATGLRRYLPALAVFWLALIEVFLGVNPGLQQGHFPLLLHLPFSQYSFPFAAGLLVPLFVRRRWIGPATPLLAMALLVSYEATSGLWVGLSVALMGLGCLCLVATAVQSGLTSARLPNQPLVALGDWSYALYLCHVPVIRAVCWILPAAVPAMPLWFACLGVPVTAAIVLGKLDLAMYRRLKRWVDRSRVKAARTLCFGFIAMTLLISGYAYVKRYTTRPPTGEVAPLAAKIVASMYASEPNLAPAAVGTGLLEDQTLAGNFDSIAVTGKTLHLEGWAADATSSNRPLRILVFQCAHYLGAFARAGNRPDVAASLKISPLNLAFDISTPPFAECSSKSVDGLLLSDDGHFAIISGKIKP